MKILHLCTSDTSGGAARAAYRLHKALNKAGHESYMLVRDKLSNEKEIISTLTSSFKKLREKILSSLIFRFIAKKYRPTYIFSINRIINSDEILAKINIISPDIIHLHWVNDQFLDLNVLHRLNIPIIWSLHDMWAFTGGCHYDSDCKNYQTICNTCPTINSKKYRDLSFKQSEFKKYVYSSIKNIIFNGLSKWITRCAKESAITNNYPVITLPNTIDINTFSPIEKNKARKKLNLPFNKKIILSGAIEINKDTRKGYDLLLKAFTHLKDKDSIILGIFGNKQINLSINISLNAIPFGMVSDDSLLNLIYNAADVMVVPSRQENLANTIMESLACGTPVVAFDIGGNSDMVEHKKNGYLATPFDCTDLANGIEWVLYNNDYENLRKNAREKVISTFSEEVVIPKYIEAYTQMIMSTQN